MNELHTWQVKYEKVVVTENESNSFNILFISNRLYKLIQQKGIRWGVMYLPINNPILLSGYESVLTSPTKGSVLFIRVKPIMTNFKFNRWEKR